MRLFRPSKSQASLDKHLDSRDESPVQGEPSYPPTSGYNEGQYQAPSPQQHREPGEERYYRDTAQAQAQSPTNPVHVLGRSQSGRVPPSAVDTYAKDPLHQPTVNVVPPLTPNTPTQQAHFIQAQEPTLQSPPFRNDRDKKSKRAFFGLGSKKDEKESAGDRVRVNRNSSVLRKASHQQPQTPQHLHGPQAGYPSQQSPDGRGQGFPQELEGENHSEDPEHYEEYYRAQSQYENSNNSGSHQPVRYAEDGPHFEQPPTPRHKQQPSLQSQQSQRGGYQLYHEASSANNSNTYLHQQLQNAASNHPLRPPSPASFGPPSPLVVGNNNPDSRPPTADPHSRSLPYSLSQGLSQKDLLHQRQVSQDIPRLDERDIMGRSEVTNSGSRQQQRDDDRHLHYPNQQDPRIRTQSHDQGRNTPPPRNREDLASLDYGQLMAKHEELLAKYSKVKRYYFERDAQVMQLQNTVANQRLSLSRTSLDDAQYTTRFERLNGAIQNLAFNIRKDWRRMPNWLAPVCNRDACQVGTKEMTAVGRACITRWLFEYVFERVFHPGLEPNLSFHLKSIERNLRHAQYAFLTGEQQDDLMAKIMTWRFTTMEGLQDALNSKNASTYQENLEHTMTRQLNDYLNAFLIDPPPPGIPDSLYGVVQLAVSICQHIPMESRDIRIEYFMPASHINEIYMKIDQNMTALQNPGSAVSASDHVYNLHGDDDENSASSSVADHSAPSQADIEAQIRSATDAGMAPNPVGVPPPRGDSMASGGKLQGPHSSDKTSSTTKKPGSLFGGLVNRRPAPSETSSAGAALTMQNSDSSRSGEPSTDAYNLHSLTNGLTDGKIRFAAFLAVEVRGKSVLTSKDLDKGKDGDKLSTHGNDSAGPGQQAADGGSNNGSKSDKGTNVLAKAPVYVFE